MRLMLDTNVCIRLLNGSSTSVAAQLKAHDPAEIGISSVVRAELAYGARRSQRVASNLRLLQRFVSPFQSVPFDDHCAEQYGVIRSQLVSAGVPIGPNDLMIAATALAHNTILVTHNVREFTRVAGLAVEDWEATA